MPSTDQSYPNCSIAKLTLAANQPKRMTRSSTSTNTSRLDSSPLLSSPLVSSPLLASPLLSSRLVSSRLVSSRLYQCLQNLHWQSGA
ncbi:hypothetical protein TcWFU_006654 [Taenia crassiceps]|uniref:Uncharacterized protein n=1 Tax=Taenia crassiceps TaxID=6207 RepID=A0ABR4Q8Z6_9CEST